MELAIQPFSDLVFTSHSTFLESEIENSDESLRNRPKWRGGFTLNWQVLASMVINLEALFVGSVLDSSIPTGDRSLDPYTRVDLALTWTPSTAWRFFLAIDNLFDEDFQEVLGFPAPGVTPRFGMRATF